MEPLQAQLGKQRQTDEQETRSCFASGGRRSLGVGSTLRAQGLAEKPVFGLKSGYRVFAIPRRLAGPHLHNIPSIYLYMFDFYCGKVLTA